MKTKYSAWIEKYNRDYTYVRGRCTHATWEMLEEFPELERIRGHVYDYFINRSVEHWWLVDRDGEIIDPTVRQFSAVIEYESWDEGADEPTGKCVNCGAYCYDNGPTCSFVCSEEFKRSLEV